jgi:hypothetical protein
MQFQSRAKRNQWIAFFLNFLPDLFIAGVTTFVSNGNDISIFFLVFAGLQVVYLLVWIRKTIWEWIYFSFKGRKIISSYILDHLKKNKFPEPADYFNDPDEYYKEIFDNAEEAPEIRVKAALEYATLKSFTALGQYQHAIRFHIASEDAIEQYKKTF